MTKTIIPIALLAIFSITSPVIASENDIKIDKKQVAKFMKVNRSNLLLQYQCQQPSGAASCSVVCSSGGHTYITSKNVNTAYYAERLSKINSSLAGFFLVVDVNETDDGKDLWATLQRESSCTFEGLTPAL